MPDQTATANTTVYPALTGRDAAKVFLDALGTAHTFQTFHDSNKADRSLSRVINGTLDEHQQRLADLNHRGAGIFVVVSQTDLEGAANKNVMKPRALWLDFDNGEPDPARLATLPAPSMVVQSKNGKHLYWLLKDGEDLAELPAAIAGLVAYMGADKGAKGISRVMRVPGFQHRKAEAFDTVLLKCDATLRYAIADVACKVPVMAGKPAKALKPAKATKPAPVATEDNGGDVEKLAAAIRKLPRAEQLTFIMQSVAKSGAGSRNQTLSTGARYAYSFIAAGVPHDWIESQLVSAAAMSGLSTAEATQTIESAFDFTERAGFGLQGDAKLWHAFTYFYGESLRYNTRSMFIELDGDTEVDADVERIRFAQTCAGIDKAPSATNFASNFFPWAKKENSYDPAIDALNALPVMTVEEAHTELEELALVMGLDDTHTMQILKRWLVGMVKRVLQPGCAMPWGLVLAGEGGCGKSSFFEKLAVLGLHRSVRSVGMAGMDRDELMKFAKATVVVLDELDQVTRKADLGAVKTHMTQTEDTFRIPYDRSDRTHKRSYAIGATVNGEQPLHDDGAGLRRWVVIAMEGGELEGTARYAHYVERCDQIHAAALALMHDGFSCLLSTEETEVERSRKEQYTDRGLIYVEASSQLPRLKASIEAAAADGNGYAFHIDQLVSIMTDGKAYASPTDKLNLEKALKEDGWHVKKQVWINGRNARLCWPKTVRGTDISRCFDKNIGGYGHTQNPF